MHSIVLFSKLPQPSHIYSMPQGSTGTNTQANPASRDAIALLLPYLEPESPSADTNSSSQQPRPRHARRASRRLVITIPSRRCTAKPTIAQISQRLSCKSLARLAGKAAAGAAAAAARSACCRVHCVAVAYQQDVGAGGILPRQLIICGLVMLLLLLLRCVAAAVVGGAGAVV
jgi:hypothetical protein